MLLQVCAALPGCLDCAVLQHLLLPMAGRQRREHALAVLSWIGAGVVHRGLMLQTLRMRGAGEE